MMKLHVYRTLFGAAAMALTVSSSASAKVTEIQPGADLGASIAACEPGDELVLAGGTYVLQSKLTIGVSGTAQAPILVRAKEGEKPVIQRNDANQNTINIEYVKYLELRGLEVVGGSHGIRMRDSSFITIRDCDIHDMADVAVSANHTGSTYEGLHIVGNHIHDTGGTGEGMYLGCNSNGCQMFDSVIEHNWVHHTNAGDVVQGDGIEIKEGSYNNVVRHNVIHDTNYPCILTYSTSGNGAPNRIEGNLMWNCGDHGIQSAADAVIENNIILGAAQDGIRCQPHQSGSPSGLVIRHNTILMANKDAIRVSGASGSVVIANNALYAEKGNALRVGGELSGVVVAGNVGVGGTQGVSAGFDASGDITADFVAADYLGGVPNDVFPAVGSALIGKAESAHLNDEDFNTTPRDGALDVGAYVFDAGGNPGWTLGAGFKEMADTSSGSGGAGGATGAGGSSGSSGETSGAGAGSPAAGSGGASSTNSGGAGETVDSGCSVSGPSRGSAGAWLLLLGLAAFMRRRSLLRA